MNKLSITATLAGAVSLLALASPASALPVSPGLASGLDGASTIQAEQVQFRGRGGFRGGGRGFYRGGGYRRGYGYGAAGLGIGLATGALIGGALAGPGYYGYGPGPAYYGPGPGYVRPGYMVDDEDASCAQRFRSYDPASGTYLGYDGQRHPCP